MSPVDQDGRLKKYLELLNLWNEKLSLTSIKKEAREEEAVRKSLEFLPHVSGKIIDIGSGNGIPGIVLKAAAPYLEIWLCESNQKKAHFLEEVIHELGLEKIEVLKRNFLELKEHAGLFDTVISRAFGIKKLKKSGFLLKSGGRIVTYHPGENRYADWKKEGDFLIWQKS